MVIKETVVEVASHIGDSDGLDYTKNFSAACGCKFFWCNKSSMLCAAHLPNQCPWRSA